ncbi:hypothetical protein B4168_0042 [Anoxybacillus flavithermus]|nr:hypothetical protein B4168_0042 [Anoxybacillus flavithermus]OAO83911.1 hypothetical protein GT23_3937 [Parageobacillus thermoglucosidasius]
MIVWIQKSSLETAGFFIYKKMDMMKIENKRKVMFIERTLLFSNSVIGKQSAYVDVYVAGP